MATSLLPGGAYLSADKKTWHDANGKVIPSPLDAAPAVQAVVVDPVAEPAPEPASPAPKSKRPSKGESESAPADG